MSIQNHRLLGATYAHSPNQSGTITPRFIVMHYTAGWTAQSAIDTFRNENTNVSAHITIDTDGTVYQHVPFNKKAWHAGPSSFAGYTGLNSHSIGIELVNPGFLRRTRDGNYIDAYNGVHSPEDVGEVVTARCPRAGSGTFYWPVYTEAQMEAAEQVTRMLMDDYPIMDVITHEEIDTRGWKTDPGPAFPMNRFKALLSERVGDSVLYEVTAQSLYVRGGPGTHFSPIRGLRRGDKVVELDRRGDWVKIDSDGWTHGGFLRRLT